MQVNIIQGICTEMIAVEQHKSCCLHALGMLRVCVCVCLGGGAMCTLDGSLGVSGQSVTGARVAISKGNVRFSLVIHIYIYFFGTTHNTKTNAL